MKLNDFTPDEQEILLQARNKLLQKQKASKSLNSDSLLNENYYQNIERLESIGRETELDELTLTYLSGEANNMILHALSIQKKVRNMIERGNKS
jgi:hypothetical protein